MTYIDILIMAAIFMALSFYFVVFFIPQAVISEIRKARKEENKRLTQKN